LTLRPTLAYGKLRPSTDSKNQKTLSVVRCRLYAKSKKNNKYKTRDQENSKDVNQQIQDNVVGCTL
jgi:hypothetical protein